MNLLYFLLTINLEECMKMMILLVLVLMGSVLFSNSGICDPIEVLIQGIDDGVRSNQQQDLREAVMDAKLKAIERAGVEVLSITQVENFQIKYDLVESSAKAALLPGFQIIDMGYQANGVYMIVLSGKVSTESSGVVGESIDAKEVRFAETLWSNGDTQEAKDIIFGLWKKGDDCVVQDWVLYYRIQWEITPDPRSDLTKLKAYYPNFPRIVDLENTLKDREAEFEAKSLQNVQNFVSSMEFISISGGSFTMGSPDGERGRINNEGPLHHVTLSAFQIMATEVTQAHWQVVMGSTPSKFKGDDFPVETVSWIDVQKFVAELNKMDPGKGYRLPTEAEWEYACRAGSTSSYCFGESEAELGDYGWYNDYSGIPIHTHAVAEKQPNAWGLYDMHGNVSEWCQDWYGDYDRGSSENPAGKSSGLYRVLRGGDCFSNAAALRCGFRDTNKPSSARSNIGFRLCRTSQ